MRRKTDHVITFLRKHHRPFSRFSPWALLKSQDALQVIALHKGESIRLQGRSGDPDFLFVVQGAVRAVRQGREVAMEATRGPFLPFPGDDSLLAVEAAGEALVVHADGGVLARLAAFDELAADSGVLTSEQETRCLEAIWANKAFANLPIESVSEVFRRMERRSVTAGDAVVTQGDKGESFFAIAEGTAEVWRQDVDDDAPRMVATLEAGDSFGEEALMMGGRRNATVRMSADGILLALGKDDFTQLIVAPLVRAVTPEAAMAMAGQGARILDVRYQEEFEEAFVPNSRLIPLPELRERAQELDPEASTLIICASGRRARVAALLLRQRNFNDVAVIEGGIRGWPHTLESAF